MGLLIGAAVPAFSQTPTITTFAMPSDVGPILAGLSVGSDGALWFTDQSRNRIGRITTAGSVTTFPILSAGAGLGRIQPGPDGALWFSQPLVNKIGRMTTAGVVTEFTVPTAASGPAGLWAGPDGNIWFPEFNTNKIAKLTTSGTFTEYNIPTLASQPRGLGPGPDGAMWFVEQAGNKIGRITTTGAITEFTVPTQNANLRSIKSGPDGALWFVERSGEKIGRITTSGSFTEFPLVAGSRASYLREGPDGAMWFINDTGNKLGRITMTGAVTEFSSPVPLTSIDAIVTGPDGNLWFTAALPTNLAIVGYLVPPTPTSPLFSAVLPSSRSVQVGSTATAFASIINSGQAGATGCKISLVGDLAANMSFQTTDPQTNTLTGTLNTPVAIAAGATQSFLIAFAANAPNVSTDVQLGYSCDGLPAAGTITGVNTLALTFNATPAPDAITIGLTPSADGYLRTAAPSNTEVFVISSINIGAAGSLTARVRPSTPSLPLTASICRTNPTTGVCTTPLAPTVTATIAQNEISTWGAFLTASGAIPRDPGRSRVVFEFVDQNGVVRGSTSTAVTTEPRPTQ